MSGGTPGPDPPPPSDDPGGSRLANTRTSRPAGPDPPPPGGVPLVLRAAVSLGLLVGLAAWLDAGAVVSRLASLRPSWVLAALAVSVVQVAVLAWRWSFTARRLAVDLPWSVAWREYYLSIFLNQVLPGGVLGDVARAWRQVRSQVRLHAPGGPAVRAVVFERLSAQMVMTTVAGVSVFFLPVGAASGFRPVLIGAGLAAGALVVALAAWTRRRPAGRPAAGRAEERCGRPVGDGEGRLEPPATNRRGRGFTSAKLPTRPQGRAGTLGGAGTARTVGESVGCQAARQRFHVGETSDARPQGRAGTLGGAGVRGGERRGLPAGRSGAERSRQATLGGLGRVLAEVGAAHLTPGAFAAQVVSAAVVVATYLTTFVLAARAVGVETPLSILLPLVAPVLMSMLIPVTVAGWGLREGAAAVLWGVAGLTAADGVAVSVAYGLLVLAGSTPGAVFLAAGLRRGRSFSEASRG